jgi:hypothetical protein
MHFLRGNNPLFLLKVGNFLEFYNPWLAFFAFINHKHFRKIDISFENIETLRYERV